MDCFDWQAISFLERKYSKTDLNKNWQNDIAFYCALCFYSIHFFEKSLKSNKHGILIVLFPKEEKDVQKPFLPEKSLVPKV